jgi:hypothetical protein
MAADSPQFEGVQNVRLLLTEETSELIAELRASYKEEGEAVASLSRVVENAVFSYHEKYFLSRSRPKNSAKFLSTQPKDK